MFKTSDLKQNLPRVTSTLEDGPFSGHFRLVAKVKL